MLSKLTIAGLHNYSLQIGEDLWVNLDLPEGIDKDLVVNEILRQASEFPTLYPDYDFIKLQIGEWSKKWKRNFSKWYDAYITEYEALYNVDVKDTIKEVGKNSGQESTSGGMNRKASGGGSSSGNSSDTNTKSKAAYDADTFQNVERDSITALTSMNSSENHSENETHSESSSNSSTHEIETTHIKQGNQGTTMSQTMLMAELNVWSWNLYQHIAEIFVNEFCICIYE